MTAPFTDSTNGANDGSADIERVSTAGAGAGVSAVDWGGDWGGEASLALGRAATGAGSDVDLLHASAPASATNTTESLSEVWVVMASKVTGLANSSTCQSTCGLEAFTPSACGFSLLPLLWIAVPMKVRGDATPAQVAETDPVIVRELGRPMPRSIGLSSNLRPLPRQSERVSSLGHGSPCVLSPAGALTAKRQICRARRWPATPVLSSWEICSRSLTKEEEIGSNTHWGIVKTAWWGSSRNRHYVRCRFRLCQARRGACALCT